MVPAVDFGMIPQTTQMRALAGAAAWQGLLISKPSIKSDFWHAVPRWPRRRYAGPTFPSIEREMGLVESGPILTQNYSTKRRML
jgi:hypothetical protein